ncbi:MAG: glycosyltransferase family 2 protein [Opitutaceae bacterium]
MPATQPLVSVIIPNYNHGRFLPKCLAGLQRQTLSNLEIVLTDDGSTDGSPDIIRDYARRDPRIKPNYFPTNLGVTKACEDIFSRATGKYLYCAAADDFVISEHFFKNAVTALEADPRPAGFYGVTAILQAETEKIVMTCGTAEVYGYNAPLQCATGFINCRSVVTTPSAIWRRDLYMKHGGTEMDQLFPKLGPQVDFFLSHLLAFLYGMYYEKTAFACQRVFAAKTNYSANMNLWETAQRYAELEKGLRATGLTYPGIENDWMRWRAFWMVDTIKKSGVNV